MKYYVFQLIKDGIKTYGFIPEDKIQEEAKEFAFKVIDSLPEPLENVDGQQLTYKLSYNENQDVFYWEVESVVL